MAAVRTWYLPAPCASLSVQAHTSPHEGVIFAAALDAPLPGIRLYSLAHRAALLPSQLTGPAEPSLLASRATTDSVLVHSTVADGANVIVSGDRAGNVTIQARQGENSELHVLRTLKAHRGAVTAAASGHASLATAGADGTVQVRALGSLSDAPLAIYSEPAASVTSLAWVSPHILAATGAGARLSLVDFRSHTSAGRLIDPSRQASWQLSVAAVPATQHLLVTGASDGALSLWDTRQQRAPLRCVTGQHNGAVFALICHPLRANTAFSCAADCRLLAWRWDDTQRDEFTQQFEADSALLCLDFHQEQNVLLAASEGHGLYAVQPTL